MEFVVTFFEHTRHGFFGGGIFQPEKVGNSTCTKSRVLGYMAESITVALNTILGLFFFLSFIYFFSFLFFLFLFFFVSFLFVFFLLFFFKSFSFALLFGLFSSILFSVISFLNKNTKH